MAEVNVPSSIHLPQGTTVGLLILQSTSPMNDGILTSTNMAPLVSLAPMTTTTSTLNNNNCNINNNNIVTKETGNKYQKQIRPAPTNGASKRASKKSAGTTPPLKPPKKYRDEESEILRCKRRLDFAKLGLPFTRANPVAVARRNERERKRVKQINNTFLALRDHLPNTYCQHKNPNKMSKVETLRGAIDYINSLQDTLDDYDSVHAALTSGCYPDQPMTTSATEDRQSPQTSDLTTTNHIIHELHNANHVLSVQAPDVSQTVSMNSPTGSTGSACSSVASSTSSTQGPGNMGASDYFTMQCGAQYSEQMMYNHHIQDTHPPLDIKEEDLLDFAKWF